MKPKNANIARFGSRVRILVSIPLAFFILYACTPKVDTQRFYLFRKGISVEKGIDSTEVIKVLDFLKDESSESINISLDIRNNKRGYSIVRIWNKKDDVAACEALQLESVYGMLQVNSRSGCLAH